jgi:hypothetical protein
VVGQTAPRRSTSRSPPQWNAWRRTSRALAHLAHHCFEALSIGGVEKRSTIRGAAPRLRQPLAFAEAASLWRGVTRHGRRPSPTTSVSDAARDEAQARGGGSIRRGEPSRAADIATHRPRPARTGALHERVVRDVLHPRPRADGAGRGRLRWATAAVPLALHCWPPWRASGIGAGTETPDRRCPTRRWRWRSVWAIVVHWSPPVGCNARSAGGPRTSRHG